MKIYRNNDYDDNAVVEIELDKYLKPWGIKYLKHIKSSIKTTIVK